MKSFYLFTLLILTACTAPSKPEKKSFDKHIGTWSFDDKGRIGKLVLKANKEFFLIVNGKVFGGKPLKNSAGKELECHYVINPNKTPIPIYLYTHEKSDPKKTQHGLRGILRFLSNGNMEVRFSFDPAKPRYNTFDAKDSINTMVMVREAK